MSFKNIIVTGANRGIGLEFVRQFLKQNPPPASLIATSRGPSTELDSLKATHSNLHVLKYDATDYASYPTFVEQVKKIVGEDGIDLLVNNAGILIRSGLDTVTAEDILKNVNVNAAAPLMLTKSLLPMLKAASAASRKTVVANITSSMGSIAENTSGGHYPYRASKAALNMIGKSLSLDLKPDNIIILSLHPGWVRTDMGGSSAQIDTFTSVSGLIQVIQTSDMASSGNFIRYNGTIIPF